MALILDEKVKKRSSFEKKMLLRKISMMDDLPTPNVNAVRAIKLLRQEEVDLGELVGVIERDQSLVAKILKIVNSGYYSLRSTIDSVATAINLLGLINVKQIIYSASIMDLFTEDEKKDWDHSYSTMVMMTNLMKENDIPAASNLSMTMLMHDLGKVVLRKFAPLKYKSAVAYAFEKEIPTYQAEEEILQVNHAEAAEILLKKWDMSEDIIKPVAFHHTYDKLPDEYVLETALVQFVNWVDKSARGRPTVKPSAELLEAAGFEGIDGGYWVRYQRDLIDLIEREENGQ